MNIRTRATAVLLAAAAVLAPAVVATAPTAEAAGWTSVRSTSTSNTDVLAVMRDGARFVLEPGQSTFYYRSEVWAVQWGPGTCVKVQVGTGSWFTLPTSRAQWTPPEDKASAVKAWRCTG